ncbi:MAG: aminodeoxychorismate synthase component I [Gammaproteobacteria bacterium]|nr:aminodeoxychorismate synthase component I [Gammaproteobacteria bacterium]
MLQRIVLRDPAIAQWLIFSDPVDVLIAQRPSEVLPALRAAERRVKNEDLYAAGFLTYEAASGLDDALETHAGGALPLLCFGLFAQGRISDQPGLTTASPMGPADWHMLEQRQSYVRKIEKIKRRIAAGDTYQINYTVRQETDHVEDAIALFRNIAADAPYGAYLDCGEHIIVSASPELFFRRNEDRLICKPMKGTSHRGLTATEDIALRETLRESTKNRAENVMILDMIRNDMGRVAENGTVDVTSLYDVEKYPTVWQMTSTVVARTNADVCDVIAALFPSASVTGAPKVSSMRIIRELEESPRGIYTGAIGYFGPDNRAQFNVAIRTALIEKESRKATYGVGGGIVWYSDADDEYDECLTKAKVLSRVRTEQDFDLLETLLWTPEHGYALLEEHLNRLCASADYFDYVCDRTTIEEALLEQAGNFSAQKQRVRLTLNKYGQVSVSHQLLEDVNSGQPREIVLAAEPVDRSDQFLYHKTTHRQIYEDARRKARGGDDVLLWNGDGFITETCVANVALDIDGTLYTPPVEAGLLGGTYRNWLLSNGMARERPIHIDELDDGIKLVLFNSVRAQYAGVLRYPESQEADLLDAMGATP